MTANLQEQLLIPDSWDTNNEFNDSLANDASLHEQYLISSIEYIDSQAKIIQQVPITNAGLRTATEVCNSLLREKSKLGALRRRQGAPAQKNLESVRDKISFYANDTYAAMIKQKENLEDELRDAAIRPPDIQRNIRMEVWAIVKIVIATAALIITIIVAWDKIQQYLK